MTDNPKPPPSERQPAVTTQATSNTGRQTMKNKQLKLWFLVPLLVFVGFIIMLFMRLGQPTEILPSKALQRPVPSFELPLLSDTSRVVNNDVLPTQPFLLNVWGSWCPTCIVEHPFLLELQERGVTIVGVNYKDEIADALGYLNRHRDPFVLSLQDLDGSFALDLGLTGAPETFVVDQEGYIRQHIVGEINADNWQQRIAPCLMVLNDSHSSEQAVQEVCQ